MEHLFFTQTGYYLTCSFALPRGRKRQTLKPTDGVRYTKQFSISRYTASFCVSNYKGLHPTCLLRRLTSLRHNAIPTAGSRGSAMYMVAHAAARAQEFHCSNDECHSFEQNHPHRPMYPLSIRLCTHLRCVCFRCCDTGYD